MSSQIEDNVGFEAISVSEFEDTSTFTIILISIVVAWLIIDLLNRFVFNLSYNTIGLNRNSAWHSFLVLITVIILFVAAVWVIDAYQLVPGGLSQQVESIDTPAVDIQTDADIPSNVNDILDPRNGSFISS